MPIKVNVEAMNLTFLPNDIKQKAWSSEGGRHVKSIIEKIVFVKEEIQTKVRRMKRKLMGFRKRTGKYLQRSEKSFESIS